MASSAQADDRETGEKFYKFFQAEAASLRQHIDTLSDNSLAGGEHNDATEYCIAGIQRLSDQVKDASVYIPARDQKTYIDSLKSLQTHLSETRETHAPKPKFSFKNAHKRPSATSLSDAAATDYKPGVGERDGHLAVPPSRSHSHAGTPLASSAESSVAPTPARGSSPDPDDNDDNDDDFGDEDDNAEALAMKEAVIRRMSFSQASSVHITRQSHSHIILPPSAARAMTSGTLSNLRRCVIDMSAPSGSSTGRAFAGLTLKNIKESLLVCGRVAGATHVTGLKDCVIVVDCRQFRMHECERCDVYLRVSGRPIIEDCSGVRFAPLPGAYENGAQSNVQNQWNQVDDFKWLKAEPSPNWLALPAEMRIAEEVWLDTVPGKPGIGVSDILQAVGVRRK